MFSFEKYIHIYITLTVTHISFYRISLLSMACNTKCFEQKFYQGRFISVYV